MRILEGAASCEFVDVEAGVYIPRGYCCLVRLQRDKERISLRTADDHDAHCQVSRHEKRNKLDQIEVDFESLFLRLAC